MARRVRPRTYWEDRWPGLEGTQAWVTEASMVGEYVAGFTNERVKAMRATGGTGMTPKEQLAEARRAAQQSAHRKRVRGKQSG